MCLYPTLIKNRKYIPNKKNGGIVPRLPLIYDKENDKIIEDKRVLLVPVGCGKCIECMKKKNREWSVRLQEEIKISKNGIFVTLTFSNKSIYEIGKIIEEQAKNNNTQPLKGYERDNEIATIAVRRFLERWRKKHKKSVKHWLVTELGHEGTENIHLHGIIWTEHREDIDKIWKSGKDTGGFTYPKKEDKNYVGLDTINYICKYINKIDKDHKEYKPKILCSPGIGGNYIETSNSELNKYKGKETKETYTTRQGIKLGLPIYYRNKIYTDEEKEELWLNKLDEEIRYVGGEKVSIKTNDEEYYRLLEYHRNINTKLGYGNNEKNWDRKLYENQKRDLKYRERIKKEAQKEHNKKIEILNELEQTKKNR